MNDRDDLVSAVESLAGVALHLDNTLLEIRAEVVREGKIRFRSVVAMVVVILLFAAGFVFMVRDSQSRSCNAVNESRASLRYVLDQIEVSNQAGVSTPEEKAQIAAFILKLDQNIPVDSCALL